jgi:hypothetical protein
MSLMNYIIIFHAQFRFGGFAYLSFVASFDFLCKRVFSPLRITSVICGFIYKMGRNPLSRRTNKVYLFIFLLLLFTFGIFCFLIFYFLSLILCGVFIYLIVYLKFFCISCTIILDSTYIILFIIIFFCRHDFSLEH